MKRPSVRMYFPADSLFMKSYRGIYGLSWNLWVIVALLILQWLCIIINEKNALGDNRVVSFQIIGIL